MPQLRVLVVEDSLTVRKYLLSVLATDPDIHIVAEAQDGREAIELCLKHKPDVITMDMMLPVMTGLSATEYIMAYCPTPILIVSSSVNRGELFKTYDALAAGAVDVLDKPDGMEADGTWERRFLSTVKLVSRISVITHPRARLWLTQKYSAPRAATSIAPDAVTRRARVVAIGASTGGPAAIVEVLRGLPTKFHLPILIVLHINELFGPGFADWLGAQLQRRVIYAKGDEVLAAAAGGIVMAPSGRHMTVSHGKVVLTMDAERHSCRPSVDTLFESVAAEYGTSAVGCLLTGMGRDGAAGLLRIRQAGGLTIAQDEATSVVYGMPREAMLIGAATQVLPLYEIGAALAAVGE
jgi:two-component system, chemotaxis family, protein-glutamate methylesterase/glutaminase